MHLFIPTVMLTSRCIQGSTSIFTTIIRPKVIMITARSSLDKILNVFKAKLTALEGRKSVHCESCPNPWLWANSGWPWAYPQWGSSL